MLISKLVSRNLPAALQAQMWRCTSVRSNSEKSLREILATKIPCEVERIIKFRKENGKTKIGDINVNMMYGGMRGMLALICETSVLDPEEGIRFRGLSVPEIRKVLPKAKGGEEPLPEGIFWLLMTGECPSEMQVKQVTCEWNERADLPEHVVKLINDCPKTLHPMTQLSIGILALNHESKFNKAYTGGFDRKKLWTCCFEDSMDLIAKLSPLCALIYNKAYRDGKGSLTVDKNLDWSANFAKMIGFEDPKFLELMRLYLTIHCDHEGGNVSAHATHLVGSALSDPFVSLASGINGLAGPLHGLANQEVLKFLIKMQKETGNSPDNEKIKAYCENELKSGRVIPGFGHAVLRKTDPRYTVQREFALKHLPDDEMFKLVSKLFEVVPPILKATGKVQNPWPNVDAHSGVILTHYGLKEMNYYTVLFGLSRALGVLSSLVWSRAVGMPIERPKSMSTGKLMEHVEKLKEKSDCKK